MTKKIFCLCVTVFLVSGVAFSEKIILKNGNTLTGIVTHKDEEHLTVKLPNGGQTQVRRSDIERVVEDYELKDWEDEQRRLEDEKEDLLSEDLFKIIEKDERSLTVRTLVELGAEDRRFEIGNLVTPPDQEGNAAANYWIILDADRFPLAKLYKVKDGQKQWNLNHPVYSDIIKSSRMKDCHFYPEFLPYPTGIWPTVASFRRLLDVGNGLIAVGNDRIERKLEELGLASLESALIFGVHLSQYAPVRSQITTGNRIQMSASRSLADYYENLGNKEKAVLFLEYSKAKEREIDALLLKRRSLLHDFNAGRVQQLMSFSEAGEDMILRAYAMNLLVLLKLAGEQQPLRSDVLQAIPLEASTAFKKISFADSKEIEDLLYDIEQRDKNNFIRSHSKELLSLNSIQLKRGIRVMLNARRR